jgi:hypothetical protein
VARGVVGALLYRRHPVAPTTLVEILERLSHGRDAYLRQDWATALALDEQALALVTANGDACVLALCHRVVGLCLFRRGGAAALGRSEWHLREAIGVCLSC